MIIFAVIAVVVAGVGYIHLHREREAIFPFLSCPGLEATNWRAEQALRPAVVARKVWTLTTSRRLHRQAWNFLHITAPPHSSCGNLSRFEISGFVLPGGLNSCAFGKPGIYVLSELNGMVQHAGFEHEVTDKVEVRLVRR